MFSKFLEWLEGQCFSVQLFFFLTFILLPLVVGIKVSGLSAVLVMVCLLVASVWASNEPIGFPLSAKKERAKKIFAGQKQTIKTRKAVESTNRLFDVILGADRR